MRRWEPRISSPSSRRRNFFKSRFASFGGWLTRANLRSFGSPSGRHEFACATLRNTSITPRNAERPTKSHEQGFHHARLQTDANESRQESLELPRLLHSRDERAAVLEIAWHARQGDRG